jgi:hypothetical protein
MTLFRRNNNDINKESKMKNPRIKSASLISCLFYLVLTTNVGGDGDHGYQPKEGFVPDKETAVRIAEAVWLPIYGKVIEEEKPFRARLSNDVWTVTGTLPPNMSGGSAIAKISKTSGCILGVGHGR